MLKHLGLFEGIGGFSFAAKQMGWQTVAWSEWNEFRQKVLRYHYPEAVGYGDISKIDFKIYANKIDVLTGGFPCQPFSDAGKKLGTSDARYLWPEMLRAIREVQPRYIVGENVRGFVSWNKGMVFDTVQSDLENEGYEIIPVILPACSVGAPHRRYRIWIVAFKNTNKNGWGCSKREEKSDIRKQRNTFPGSNERLHTDVNEVGTASDSTEFGRDYRSNNREERYIQGNGRSSAESESERERWNDRTGQASEIFADSVVNGLQGRSNPVRSETTKRYTGSSFQCNTWENFPTQSPLCGGDDGLSIELLGITFSAHRIESLKAYGDAIVPQVALQIFKAIELMHLNLAAS